VPSAPCPAAIVAARSTPAANTATTPTTLNTPGTAQS
jgi:hypothetical protein